MAVRFRLLSLSETERRHTQGLHAQVTVHLQAPCISPSDLFSHRFWGKTIFALAVGAVLMGITEYSIL